MTITIKPIAIEDIAGFRQALDRVAHERRYLLLLEAPAPEQVEAFVRANIERKVAQFVAVDKGQVIGWCDIRPHTWSGVTHTGVLGMGLLAEYRGQGLGYRLLEATVNQALANGLTRIELEVFASNRAAIALYEKFGFEREGLKRKARYVDGSWDDFVMMALVRQGDRPS
ncbi:MAG TPA: GNAT family protein [Anaerolineae bacterium]|jgi:RimJ/RimL family protein N-acetyltransferase